MNPKTWSHHWQDPAGAALLNEDAWFRLFQPLLLELVNTPYGRDLLCVPQEYGRIVHISKNEVRVLMGSDDEQAIFISDFRVGAKWANVIRTRWPLFQAYAKTFYEDEIAGKLILRPMLVWGGRPVAAHATDTFYPDPSAETTTVDGHVQTTAASWAGAHDAASGSTADDSSTTLIIDSEEDTGSANFTIYRAGVLFDTSSITDGNVISAAILSVWPTVNNNNDNDGQDYLNVVSFAPASNTAVVTGDFDAFGTTKFATDVDFGTLATGAYEDLTFNATGIAAISKTDVSKFGLREGHDIENVAIADNTRNFLRVSSADNTGTTQDPKLVVTHASAFTPKVIVI